MTKSFAKKEKVDICKDFYNKKIATKTFKGEVRNGENKTVQIFRKNKLKWERFHNYRGIIKGTVRPDWI